MRDRIAAALAALVVLAAVPAAARASDSMGSPTPLAFGAAQTVDTSGFDVEPSGEPNTTSPFTQNCNSAFQVGVARTAWYSVAGTGGQITVTTDGSDYDTAMFVYAGSPTGPLVTCNDDTSPTDLQSTVSFASATGTTYLIQAGRACNDASSPPCNGMPAAGTLKITAIGVVNQDLDGDGYKGAQFGGPDCVDSNPAIHPGAVDIPHDGVDQDCSGADAPYPALGAKTLMSVLFFRGGLTRVTKLSVSGAPAGATIVVTCSTRKRGCPFARKSLAASRANLAKLFKRKKLKAKAVVTVTVTKPGFIGSWDRFTMRNRKVPKHTTMCLEPGSAKPQPTCS